MSIGEQIIDEIVKQGMVQLAYPSEDLVSYVFRWKANSSEQLDALIENFTLKRIDDLRKRAERAEKALANEFTRGYLKGKADYER